MSTNAFVGEVDGDGNYLARYVHWDGYPTHLGKTLADILLYEEVTGGAEGGLARMLTVLTEQHYGWSILNADIGTEDNTLPHGEFVEHYGIAYTDCHATDWIAGNIHHLATDGLEWGYLFTARGRDAAELVVVDDETERARIPLPKLLDLTDDDWTKIECGENFERCSHYAWVHFPSVPRSSRALARDVVRAGDSS